MIRGEREYYFNDEPIRIIHTPAALTDGDVVVFFRRSDVLVAGDLVSDRTYPVIRLDEGGSARGVLDALNMMLDLAVSAWRRQGGRGSFLHTAVRMTRA